MKYDISDNELIYLYRNNNYQAFKVLEERYKKRIYGLIEKTLNKMGVVKANFDEYYSVCYLAFIKCIERFNDEYIFYSYMMQSLENVIFREVIKEKKNKSISYLDVDVIDEGFLSKDIICDSKVDYQVKEIKSFIKDKFDNLTIRIISLKLKGYSCLEIAKELSLTSKVIYNRLNKIKKELKNTFYS